MLSVLFWYSFQLLLQPKSKELPHLPYRHQAPLAGGTSCAGSCHTRRIDTRRLWPGELHVLGAATPAVSTPGASGQGNFMCRELPHSPYRHQAPLARGTSCAKNATPAVSTPCGSAVTVKNTSLRGDNFYGILLAE